MTAAWSRGEARDPVGELRPFRDRAEAGRKLAAALADYRGRPDLLVLALPRGGVPVAREIAHALGAPLDVLIVRKLGAPFQPELALGAIAAGGVRVVNRPLLEELGLAEAAIDALAERERAELERRESAYRPDRPPLELSGRTVILVDDGVATGATISAAIQAARVMGARRVVVAVPVAPPEAVERLAGEADEVVFVLQPEYMLAIGVWYEDFPQLTDSEVRRLLSDSSRRERDAMSPER